MNINISEIIGVIIATVLPKALEWAFDGLKRKKKRHKKRVGQRRK